MGRYVVRRVLWMMLVVLLLTLFAFLIFFVLPPENPAVALAGRNATPETIKEVSKIYGLDKPIPVQYLLFVKRLFVGDQFGWPGLGFSFKSRVAVGSFIFQRMAITLMLAVGAALIWLMIGIPIGILSALKPRSKSDRVAMVTSLFFISAPVFWLGQMVIFIFWFKLHWAPTPGYVGFTDNPYEWFTHMLMPWFVLAVLFAGTYARLVRGNMLEVMGEDYIRTARAKGLPERQVVVQHGLRASLTPVVTLFGLDFGSLLGGAIVTETIFNLPGLGHELVSGVFGGDLPVVMAIVVIAGLSVTFMNLIVDILYAYLDPRVRYA